ncbi:MAG: hypothetical protein NT178_15915 [Proteobacteria bacterium]|nr:hypothetical protein [Pseudomonadota bacterium]
MDIDEARIIPYLTVPVENRKPLKHVVSIFKKNRLIKKAAIEITKELAVLKITYFMRRQQIAQLTKSCEQSQTQ